MSASDKKKRSKKNLGYVSRTQLQYVDADYLDQLSDEEFEFYKKFTQEYYQHSYSDDPLHTDPDAYKESTQRENEARRDVMNRLKRTEFNEEILDSSDVLTSPERIKDDESSKDDK